MIEDDDTEQKIFVNSEIGWLYGRLEEPNPEEAIKYLKVAKELGRDVYKRQTSLIFNYILVKVCYY